METPELLQENTAPVTTRYVFSGEQELCWVNVSQEISSRHTFQLKGNPMHFALRTTLALLSAAAISLTLGWRSVLRRWRGG